MNYLFYILLAINCVLIACGRLAVQDPFNDELKLDEFSANDTDHFYPKNLPNDQWVEQKLNHFDPIDNRTWKQRYFINNTFHTRGGPVFIELGGESEAYSDWTVRGQIPEKYAKRFNALSVALEHRYYGKSHPTPDLSTKNLRYLSSEQALQDTAHFIEYLTDKLSLNSSKWIVFGRSYAGSLAAWFRLKYPHLAAGAVASSAPIEAVSDFKEYYAVVSRSLGRSCTDSIREATFQLEKELKNKTMWTVIQRQFNLCEPLNGTNLNDVSNFMEGLADRVGEVVQYHREGDIEQLCDIMTNKSLGALDRYIEAFQKKPMIRIKECLNTKYDLLIQRLSQSQWNSSVANGDRQWTYQTCTEFGFFQTSNDRYQPFGHYFPEEYFIKQCTDIFGPAFNAQLVRKSVEFTNSIYGGSKLNVRKVVFPNGSVDPWTALGVRKDLNADSPAIVIIGASHMMDMDPDSVEDSKALTEARSHIIQSLEKFLKEN